MTEQTTSRPRLTGRVAVITGCANGIGRATSSLFCREGATVIGIDVDSAGNASLQRELDAAGGKHEIHTQSIGEREPMKRLAADALARHGKIHVLFNNAAIDYAGPFETTSDEAWQGLLDVNLTAAFLLTRELLPGLKRAGGASIIHHASVDGLLGNARVPAYSTIKGAMIPMTHTMAYEFGPHDIRVNCLCSGGIYPTALSLHRLETFKKQLEEVTALRRWGTPEEIANVVLFLASDESSYVSGTVLTVDGGRTGLTQGCLPLMSH